MRDDVVRYARFDSVIAGIRNRVVAYIELDRRITEITGIGRGIQVSVYAVPANGVDRVVCDAYSLGLIFGVVKLQAHPIACNDVGDDVITDFKVCAVTRARVEIDAILPSIRYRVVRDHRVHVEILVDVGTNGLVLDVGNGIVHHVKHECRNTRTRT